MATTEMTQETADAIAAVRAKTSNLDGDAPLKSKLDTLLGAVEELETSDDVTPELRTAVLDALKDVETDTDFKGLNGSSPDLGFIKSLKRMQGEGGFTQMDADPKATALIEDKIDAVNAITDKIAAVRSEMTADNDQDTFDLTGNYLSIARVWARNQTRFAKDPEANADAIERSNLALSGAIWELKNLGEDTLQKEGLSSLVSELIQAHPAIEPEIKVSRGTAVEIEPRSFARAVDPRDAGPEIEQPVADEETRAPTKLDEDALLLALNSILNDIEDPEAREKFRLLATNMKSYVNRFKGPEILRADITARVRKSLEAAIKATPQEGPAKDLLRQCVDNPDFRDLTSLLETQDLTGDLDVAAEPAGNTASAPLANFAAMASALAADRDEAAPEQTATAADPKSDLIARLKAWEPKITQTSVPSAGKSSWRPMSSDPKPIIAELITHLEANDIPATENTLSMINDNLRFYLSTQPDLQAILTDVSAFLATQIGSTSAKLSIIRELREAGAAGTDDAEQDPIKSAKFLLGSALEKQDFESAAEHYGVLDNYLSDNEDEALYTLLDKIDANFPELNAYTSGIDADKALEAGAPEPSELEQRLSTFRDNIDAYIKTLSEAEQTEDVQSRLSFARSLKSQSSKWIERLSDSTELERIPHIMNDFIQTAYSKFDREEQLAGLISELARIKESMEQEDILDLTPGMLDNTDAEDDSDDKAEWIETGHAELDGYLAAAWDADKLVFEALLTVEKTGDEKAQGEAKKLIQELDNESGESDAMEILKASALAVANRDANLGEFVTARQDFASKTRMTYAKAWRFLVSRTTTEDTPEQKTIKAGVDSILSLGIEAIDVLRLTAETNAEALKYTQPMLAHINHPAHKNKIKAQIGGEDYLKVLGRMYRRLKQTAGGPYVVMAISADFAKNRADAKSDTLVMLARASNAIDQGVPNAELAFSGLIERYTEAGKGIYATVKADGDQIIRLPALPPVLPQAPSPVSSADPGITSTAPEAMAFTGPATAGAIPASTKTLTEVLPAYLLETLEKLSEADADGITRIILDALDKIGTEGDGIERALVNAIEANAEGDATLAELDKAVKFALNINDLQLMKTDVIAIADGKTDEVLRDEDRDFLEYNIGEIEKIEGHNKLEVQALKDVLAGKKFNNSQAVLGPIFDRMIEVEMDDCISVLQSIETTTPEAAVAATPLDSTAALFAALKEANTSAAALPESENKKSVVDAVEALSAAVSALTEARVSGTDDNIDYIGNFIKSRADVLGSYKDVQDFFADYIGALEQPADGSPEQEVITRFEETLEKIDTEFTPVLIAQSNQCADYGAFADHILASLQTGPLKRSTRLNLKHISGFNKAVATKLKEMLASHAQNFPALVAMNAALTANGVNHARYWRAYRNDQDIQKAYDLTKALLLACTKAGKNEDLHSNPEFMKHLNDLSELGDRLYSGKEAEVTNAETLTSAAPASTQDNNAELKDTIRLSVRTLYEAANPDKEIDASAEAEIASLANALIAASNDNADNLARSNATIDAVLAYNPRNAEDTPRTAYIGFLLADLKTLANPDSSAEDRTRIFADIQGLGARRLKATESHKNRHAMGEALAKAIYGLNLQETSEKSLITNLLTVCKSDDDIKAVTAYAVEAGKGDGAARQMAFTNLWELCRTPEAYEANITKIRDAVSDVTPTLVVPETRSDAEAGPTQKPQDLYAEIGENIREIKNWVQGRYLRNPRFAQLHRPMFMSDLNYSQQKLLLDYTQAVLSFGRGEDGQAALANISKLFRYVRGKTFTQAIANIKQHNLELRFGDAKNPDAPNYRSALSSAVIYACKKAGVQAADAPLNPKTTALVNGLIKTASSMPSNSQKENFDFLVDIYDYTYGAWEAEEAGAKVDWPAVVANLQALGKKNNEKAISNVKEWAQNVRNARPANTRAISEKYIKAGLERIYTQLKTPAANKINETALLAQFKTPEELRDLRYFIDAANGHLDLRDLRDDLEALRKASQGDKAALEQIVGRHIDATGAEASALLGRMGDREARRNPGRAPKAAAPVLTGLGTTASAFVGGGDATTGEAAADAPARSTESLDSIRERLSRALRYLVAKARNMASLVGQKPEEQLIADLERGYASDPAKLAAVADYAERALAKEGQAQGDMLKDIDAAAKAASDDEARRRTVSPARAASVWNRIMPAAPAARAPASGGWPVPADRTDGGARPTRDGSPELELGSDRVAEAGDRIPPAARPPVGDGIRPTRDESGTETDSTARPRKGQKIKAVAAIAIGVGAGALLGTTLLGAVAIGTAVAAAPYVLPKAAKWTASAIGALVSRWPTIILAGAAGMGVKTAFGAAAGLTIAGVTIPVVAVAVVAGIFVAGAFSGHLNHHYSETLDNDTTYQGKSKLKRAVALGTHFKAGLSALVQTTKGISGENWRVAGRSIGNIRFLPSVIANAYRDAYQDPVADTKLKKLGVMASSIGAAYKRNKREVSLLISMVTGGVFGGLGAAYSDEIRNFLKDPVGNTTHFARGSAVKLGLLDPDTSAGPMRIVRPHTRGSLSIPDDADAGPVVTGGIVDTPFVDPRLPRESLTGSFERAFPAGHEFAGSSHRYIKLPGDEGFLVRVTKPGVATEYFRVNSPDAAALKGATRIVDPSQAFVEITDPRSIRVRLLINGDLETITQAGAPRGHGARFIRTLVPEPAPGMAISARPPEIVTHDGSGGFRRLNAFEVRADAIVGASTDGARLQAFLERSEAWADMKARVQELIKSNVITGQNKRLFTTLIETAEGGTADSWRAMNDLRANLSEGGIVDGNFVRRISGMPIERLRTGGTTIPFMQDLLRFKEVFTNTEYGLTTKGAKLNLDMSNAALENKAVDGSELGRKGGPSRVIDTADTSVIRNPIHADVLGRLESKGFVFRQVGGRLEVTTVPTERIPPFFTNPIDNIRLGFKEAINPTPTIFIDDVKAGGHIAQAARLLQLDMIDKGANPAAINAWTARFNSNGTAATTELFREIETIFRRGNGQLSQNELQFLRRFAAEARSTGAKLTFR
ncbi:MAG: hypothetical protein EBQ96_04665 [Proteobacteria bacterium]|nr:hypothetical protein [Pseudomonadota bacterium]